MQTITDISSYRKEMAKSMVDKLFFIEKIDDVSAIVDFGCADGTMLKFISELRPDIRLVGYDSSDEMIRIAMRNNSSENIIFVTNWISIETIVQDSHLKNQKIAITLSSVIHEVYSYGNTESINLFWERLFNTGFDYIIIRDMLMSKNTNTESNQKSVEKVYKTNDVHISEFESVWGPISENKNLMHYLLKYRYSKNWGRELKENYLPLTLEDMLNKIPTDKYEYDYYNHYILPFVQNSVKKEFGITLKSKAKLFY